MPFLQIKSFDCPSNIQIVSDIVHHYLETMNRVNFGDPSSINYVEQFETNQVSKLIGFAKATHKKNSVYSQILTPKKNKNIFKGKEAIITKKGYFKRNQEKKKV